MFSLFFPRLCPYCQQPMLPEEEGVCLTCLARLPRVSAYQEGNFVERRLFGRFPFVHATAFCFYRPESPFGRIIQQSKYNQKPWIGKRMAQLFAQELRTVGSPWPYDIDAIVPIPLHLLRRLRRGYNQSEAIAEGLSVEWQLPILTGYLYRKRYLRSQVGLSGEQRRRHEDDAFAVRHAEALAGRHLLIVDDVCTTGATLQAAADALLQAVPSVRISFLTLSITQ